MLDHYIAKKHVIVHEQMAKPPLFSVTPTVRGAAIDTLSVGPTQVLERMLPHKNKTNNAQLRVQVCASI